MWTLVLIASLVNQKFYAESLKTFETQKACEVFLSKKDFADHDYIKLVCIRM